MSAAPTRPWEWLDRNGARLGGHLVAALCYVHAWQRERRASPRSTVLWPAFWLVTAGVVATMALGRGLEWDELVTEFGRSQARLAGWYRTRRGLQAALVGVVSAIWMVVVLMTIWRVPERRRRYLPSALVVFTMVCFIAVRLVSLHHADALLYNRSIAGVRIVAVVEWCLLSAATLATYWFPLEARTATMPGGSVQRPPDTPTGRSIAQSPPANAASAPANVPSGPT